MLTDGCMRVHEAARFAALGKSTLYLAMDRGDLPFIKVGRRRLIPRAALVQWLAQHVIGSESK